MKAKPLELRPTQFAVGMREVAWKTDKLKGLKDKELREFLHERPVPVVEWGKALYILDHHHLVCACWEAGVDEVPLERKADFSHLGAAKFWEEMRRLGWSHLYDQFGKGPHEPRLLPADVRGLADDPYRSLAWALRRAGGYDKSGTLFSDFKWAEFLRSRVILEPGDASFEAGLKKALSLAHTPDAARLPGFAKAAAKS